MAEPARIRVGCAEMPPGLLKRRYFDALNYLEVGATFFDPPKSATLRKRRKDAPASASFGALAWQVLTHPSGGDGYPRMRTSLTQDELRNAGDFRATEFAHSALTRLRSSCDALEAEVVVFRSPPSFAPSRHNRATMTRFFSEVATAEALGGATRVWEPQGLWELEEAAAFANELGIVCGCDPLSRNPFQDLGIFAELPGNAAYFRLHGLGSARAAFGAPQLEELVSLADSYDQLWFVFANVDKFRDAARLRRALAPAA